MRLLLATILLTACVASLPSTIILKNAADPGTMYPIAGLGTAGGGSDHGYGAHPECWASCKDGQCLEPLPNGGCGMYTEAAVASWFSLGGRRQDSANSYRNQDAVGRAFRTSTVNRSALFYQTKTGPGNPMGFNESYTQVLTILNVTGLSYVDNVMLHWPSCETGNGCQASSDPLCNWGAPTYNDTGCMLSSYAGLLAAWAAGLTRSVGVSNFNMSHLEAVAAAGLTLPTLNQVSFHLYHSQAEKPLLEYCQARGILFNSWVPLARTDSWVFQAPCAPTPVADPGAAALAAKYNLTSAQLQLVWQVQLGMAVNPRTQSAQHMVENLDLFGVTLEREDVAALWNFPQAVCSTPACTNPVFEGCTNNAK